MAKNDNAHSIRLIESIRQNADAAQAEAFAQTYPLSKAADPQKKYQWARTVCDFLEQHFDTETVISIRKACKCNDGKSIANKLCKYRSSATSIRQFVDAFNAKEAFAKLEYLSERKLRFCYPRCYCACIKRVPGEISKTWCYCTLGNAESIFREVFKGEDVHVLLIESQKAGGSRCVIEVEW